MVNKQELEREVVEALNETGLFSNVKISGNLDMEGSVLTIRYKWNSDYLSVKREFEIERLKLEQIIEEDGEANYPEVEMYFPDTPNKQGIYVSEFKRVPLEGSSDNLTGKVLGNLVKDIKSYVIRRKKS